MELSLSIVSNIMRKFSKLSKDKMLYQVYSNKSTDKYNGRKYHDITYRQIILPFGYREALVYLSAQDQKSYCVRIQFCRDRVQKYQGGKCIRLGVSYNTARKIAVNYVTTGEYEYFGQIKVDK